MARNFVRASASDNIHVDDISTARFLQLETWTVLAFFRVASLDATNESAIMVKAVSSSAKRQLRVRVENGTAPRQLDVYLNNTVLGSFGNEIELNTWYLLAITHNGTADAGGVSVYVATMDGAYLSGYGPVTGTHSGDSNDPSIQHFIVGSVWHGSSSPDWFDGDIAHVAYFTSEFSSAKVLQYLRFPSKIAAIEGAVFYWPLGFGSPEQDLSGNQNNGEVSGTPAISAMPPVALFTPRWVTFIEEEADEISPALLPRHPEDVRIRM